MQVNGVHVYYNKKLSNTGHAYKDDIGHFGRPVLQPLLPGGTAIAEPLIHAQKVPMADQPRELGPLIQVDWVFADSVLLAFHNQYSKFMWFASPRCTL
jgi:hypothetical protein